MPSPKQGEVWWANLPRPVGRRPVVLLTRSDAIPRLTGVTVAPLTRTIRGIPSEVVLSTEHGVPTLCAVSLDNILTILKKSLDVRITSLDKDTVKDIFAAVRFAFDMGSA